MVLRLGKEVLMKYVVVTGASGGMGRKTVELLANSGFFVFALDKKECERRENVVWIETDVTDEKCVATAAEKVLNVTGELFAVIHFAGVYALDSFIEIGTEELERIFRINLFGAMLVNKSFAKFLKSGSRIVITTSELAPLNPLPFTGIYAVTKAALDKYAFSLAMEMQLLGVSVSVLRAGAVKTALLGASTVALDKFCDKTELYTCNAARFKRIVDKVEARCVPPEKIAAKTLKILKKKHPKFAYSINRNPLLLMLNVLPRGLQLKIIKRVLKTK